MIGGGDPATTLSEIREDSCEIGNSRQRAAKKNTAGVRKIGGLERLYIVVEVNHRLRFSPDFGAIRYIPSEIAPGNLLFYSIDGEM